ncbi:hypothetical protein PG999_001603 [Apiospora kogelbergensis]|uniref:Uncharacterized protein n=1 Tax=Apiospora kogelbergensis TaxID=1337665 RepID=A0AAW0R614_9PEZI
MGGGHNILSPLANVSADTSLEWVAPFLEDSLAWGRAGWGGHAAGTYVAHVNPLPAFTADEGAAAQAAFRRQPEFALAHGGSSIVNHPDNMEEIITFLRILSIPSRLMNDRHG